MASVFRIEKKNIDNPQEWYEETWGGPLEDNGLSEQDDYYIFEDLGEELFMFV